MKRRREEQLIPSTAGQLWLLAALTLVALPHLLRQPLWLSTGCLGVITWRLLREFRGWPLPGRWLRLLLTLLGAAAILLTYRSILGREAGTALLTVMLCLKLIEMRTLRDAMVVIFLGYFLVIGGFLFSQSIFMGSYLFAVVLALTTALVALNHPGATLHNSRRYLSTAGGLLLQAIPIMVVLFILFPRIPGPLWSLPSDAHSGRTGLSDEMSLGNITNLATSEEIAFRVQFDGSLPAADELYWRGPVLWHTDGRHWKRLTTQQAASVASEAVQFKPLNEPVSYTVTLEPHNKQWLFALDLPATLPEIPGKATIRPDFQLLSQNRIDDRLRYQVSSHTRYNTGPVEQWEWQLALRLPEDNNPQARELIARWRTDSDDTRAIIKRALDYFREEPFWYTRQPPLLLSDHPVDQFLFETRRGFCEHYAATFTTMMRIAGIPARVVTGYQGGEINAVGNFLVVRQSDAHAWSEVWLEDAGWIRIDPTAVIPQHRVEALPDLTRFSSTAATPFSDDQILWMARSWRQFKQGWGALNHGWNQWVLGFDSKRQAELMSRLGLGHLDWRGMIGLMSGLLAVLLLMITAWLLWRRPKREDPVVKLYQRFCNKLAGRGIEREKSEGPLNFARRVSKLRPDLADEVHLITNYYQQMRYGSKRPVEWLPVMLSAVNKFRP